MAVRIKTAVSIQCSAATSQGEAVLCSSKRNWFIFIFLTEVLLWACMVGRRYRSFAARPALSSSGVRVRAVPHCQRTQEAEHGLVRLARTCLDMSISSVGEVCCDRSVRGRAWRLPVCLFTRLHGTSVRRRRRRLRDTPRTLPQRRTLRRRSVVKQFPRIPRTVYRYF